MPLINIGGLFYFLTPGYKNLKTITERRCLMSKKLKFYKNRKTNNHLSIEVDSNGTIWINLEVTSSPTKKNRYIELKVNPNPKRNDKAYVRKYLRKDPIKTRGQLLEKFNLSEDDLIEIENYLNSKKS